MTKNNTVRWVTKVIINKLPRKNLLILFCFCKTVQGGTDSQRGSTRTVLHEGV